MHALALADYLENRELKLLYRWIEAFANNAPRHQRVVDAVSPEVFVRVFKQIVGLLRGHEDATLPIGPADFYVEDSRRKHISDLLHLLLAGETVLREEISPRNRAVSFVEAAAEFERLNAAVHRLLYMHAVEFCSDCVDALLEYCRAVGEHAADVPEIPRGRPLHDPFRNRSLAFLPALRRHTTVQDTLAEFLRTRREEIVSRWIALLDDGERYTLRARVESVDTTLSEMLDEVLASVAGCTLRPPHLRSAPDPCDGAPNTLHIILVGEETIAGLLRSVTPAPEIDEFWLGLRMHLNDSIHQLLRNNVASECGRCKSMLGASRHRLRSLENRLACVSSRPNQNRPLEQ